MLNLLRNTSGASFYFIRPVYIVQSVASLYWLSSRELWVHFSTSAIDRFLFSSRALPRTMLILHIAGMWFRDECLGLETLFSNVSVSSRLVTFGMTSRLVSSRSRDFKVLCTSAQFMFFSNVEHAAAGPSASVSNTACWLRTNNILSVSATKQWCSSSMHQGNPGGNSSSSVAKHRVSNQVMQKQSNKLCLQ